MAKKPLLAEVLANVNVPNRHPSWLDKLTPELLAEVEDIRTQYAEGSLGSVDSTTLARAITKSLQARGVTMPQHKQVQRWLRESPKK